MVRRHPCRENTLLALLRATGGLIDPPPTSPPASTLFLFRDPAEVERVDDGAVAQALADRLGCAVLLPDEADTDPFNCLRFRPKAVMDRVSLDPDALDEHPPRVAVFGPARPLAEAAI